MDRACAERADARGGSAPGARLRTEDRRRCTQGGDGSPQGPAGLHGDRSMTPAASGPLIETRGLDARYGDFQALFDVNFEIAAGEVVALIGANGAGKSTLLRCLAGLLAVPPGTVCLAGQPVGGSAPHEMVRRG